MVLGLGSTVFGLASLWIANLQQLKGFPVHFIAFFTQQVCTCFPVIWYLIV